MNRFLDLFREHAPLLLPGLRWLIVFGVAYALILTCLFGLHNGTARIDRLIRNNPLFSASIGQEIWSLLPPGVRFERIALHQRHSVPGQAPLILKEARVTAGCASLFPPRLDLDVDITGLGGVITATIVPDALLQPASLHIESAWKGLSVPQLQAFLSAESLPVQLNTGNLSGTLTGVVPLTHPFSGNGTLQLELVNVGAALSLPLLRAETLEHATGKTVLHWKNDVVTLEDLSVHQALLQGKLTGNLKLQSGNLAASDMNLALHLAVEPEQLRLELLPPRTRAAFEANRQATVHIGGTPAAPRFTLE